MARRGNRKLVLIDGHSLLYRGFFATRMLTTSDGRPTNAVYSFTNMLLSLLETEKPDSIIVAFDAPAKTFRHEEFVEYKAHRRETPDELAQQVPLAKRLVQSFGIPIIEVPGFEADDLIGTLARQAIEQDYDVLIFTGDLDALQLVNERVHVRATVKGVSEVITYDPEGVLQRYGLKPDQITDFKALKGDPSDNIPGVPGIGEKTALKLLQQFGHIENLLEHLEQVKDPKLRENLFRYREQLLQNKRLATIVQDVPLEEVPFLPFRLSVESQKQLQAVLEDLEFRSILRRLPALVSQFGVQASPPLTAIRETFTCKVISNPSEAQIAQALAEAQRLAIRVAGNGAPIRSAYPQWLALSPEPSTAYLIPLAASLFLPSPLQVALEDPNLPKISYDAKRDLLLLKRLGLTARGFLFDALLAAYLLQPSRSRYPLNWLVEEYLQVNLPQEEDQQLAHEAASLLHLQPLLHARLQQEEMVNLLEQIEMPLVPVLVEMEWEGIRLDTGYLQQLAQRLETDLQRFAQDIHKLAGEEFNIGSPKQLGSILFEKLKLPVIKKTKTGYSTDSEVLQALAEQHEIALRIVQYRELAKIRSTYAEALPKLVNPETGRLHTTYNQAVAATGRLSSSEPNLQNIPIRTDLGREIRRAFVADPNCLLLSLDYSQIELRILAHMSEDPMLLEAFAQGHDIHTVTASLLFNLPPEQVSTELRRKAKTVNYAVLYGMSDYGLSQELGVPVAMARQIITDYFARFPKVKAFTQSILEEGRQKGYVRTLLGRRRYIPELNSPNRNERMAAERAAINTPFQGTAADIMKLAMIRAWEFLQGFNGQTRLLLQVHDELVLETPLSELRQVAPPLAKCMEEAFTLKVPLTVECKAGPNWRDMHPLEG